MLKLQDFNYYLPPELIATRPSWRRDRSRLLVTRRDGAVLEHRHFFDIVRYLRPGDCLVLNNSRVIPARLSGHKDKTGGAVEVLLNKPTRVADVWECLIKGRAPVGVKIIFSTRLTATVLPSEDDGVRTVRFNLSGAALMREVEKIGRVPLPPYIEASRQRAGLSVANDKRRYQTVYAKGDASGSVAAPTAGLHFTPSLLQQLRQRGVKIAEVTLQVGLGTFLPVKTDNFRQHKLHSEWAEISPAAGTAIRRAKASGGRVVAVGTTSTRTLEFFADQILDPVRPKRLGAWIDLFIYPPFKFKIIDALITNFHLPESSLLMLVSALAGRPLIRRAYQEAIKHRYRFYSYGDAMLII